MACELVMETMAATARVDDATTMLHEAGSPAATVSPGSPAPCRHWVRKGHCLMGPACAFAHDPAARLAAPPPARRRGRREKLRASNASKASSLRRFVVETLGVDALRSGSGVVDVAGGKGELSLQFARLNGVPATCVDPRAPRVDQYARKLREGRYTTARSAAWASAAVVDAVRAGDDAALAAEYAELSHIAARWEPLDDGDLGDGDDFGLPPWCRRTPEAASELAAQRARSLGTAWTARGLVARDAAAADVDAAGVAELRTVEACRDALANASCIVGMHPDAAAEPIVDFALRRRVPCFVVPCCARRRRPAAGKDRLRPFGRSTRTSSRGGGTCPRTRTSSRTSPRRTRRRGR